MEMEPDITFLERLQGPAAIILVGLIALAFVGFAAYAHYNMDQAPHRFYKILAGLGFCVFLFLRPEWTLMILPFAFPYSEVLPVSPIPLLNATNVMMAALLVSWIGHSVILRRRIFEASVWNKPLLLFLGWALGSSIFGVFYMGRGFADLYPYLQNYWYQMMGFILFFITYNTVREEKQVRLLVYLYVIGAGVGAIAVLREYGSYSYGRRVAGGMGDINGAGAYFACAIVFALELLAFRARRVVQWLLVAGSIAGSGIGLILTASRGAIVACGATCGIQAVRGGPIRMLLVAITGVALFVFTPSHVKDRFAQTQEEVAAGEIDETSGGRLDIWRAAIEVFEAHPLVGVGLGQLPKAMGETSLGANRAAHNLYLETAAQMGIPGIVLLLVLFVVGLRAARRLQKETGFPRILGNAYFYFLVTLMLANLFGGRLYSVYAAGSLSVLTALVLRSQKIAEQERRVAATNAG
ncbi:MAG: O-antigen ligase family protein [Candidatus Eisenbacteria bacterium]|uniref:O-antigen ligase family protein n=1 Tax=Eiseniibacteriota bacterium TaxID=2212470 RepID=A0A956LXW0_UNCEI|nr:O-antigen ligase family protein [Candidatus Eisenbacteria bacterium]